MAETGTHATVGSASQQAPTDGADGNAGQTSTMPAQLEKTLSQTRMKNHAVDDHMLKELCFAKFIVKCPCALCWIVLAFLVLLLVIVLQVHTFDDNFIDFADRAFSVDTDHYTEHYDAYNLAADYVNDTDAADNSTLLPQTDDVWSMTFYFTDKDYDDDMDSSSNYWILTKDYIETMIDYENMIMLDEDWKRSYCYVGEDPQSTNYSCSTSVLSVVRMIYEMANYSTMTDADIKEWVNSTLDYYYWFYNPNVNKYDNLQVYRIRSFFYAGGPFATSWSLENGTWVKESTYEDVGEISDDGFTQEGDDYETQSDLLEEWAKPMWEDITLNEQGGHEEGGLNIIYVEDLNYDTAILDQLNYSLIFFGLAVVVVEIYMSFHLHSCFLGCGAMLQILLSFVLGFFWYRVIFWIDYTDFFTLLIIFVLLGIGADDVFVFTDAWLQSIHFVDSESAQKNENAGCCVDENEETNIRRMSFTFRRAASAMLTTQATTFFAFMATAVSALMTLKAFGYWAAVVVASNYTLVITLYPAILMIHHRYIKKYEDPLLKYTCCICCTLCGKNEGDKSPEPAAEPAAGTPSNAPPATLTRQLSLKDGVGDGDDYRAIEKFLGRTWSGWIDRTKIYNLVFFAILFLVGICLAATQLEPDDDFFRLWKTSSWLYTIETVQGDFGEADTDGLLSLYITYGLEGVDRSDVKTFDSDYFGELIWDDDFSMWSTDAQEYLMSTCDDLKDSSLVYESPNSTFVKCPIEEWEVYLNAMNETYPYDAASESDFALMWYQFLESDYAEDTIAYKLSYAEEDSDGDYTVRFYAMFAELPATFSASANVAAGLRDDFDDWISDIQDGGCPDNLCDSMANSSWRWWLLTVEDNFLISAFSGMAIALPLAFIVLMISTRNWIISIFAIMDIIGVISCELCVMYIAGWKFGMVESISVIMVIGFSVDYVVHLANSYLESQGASRMERMSFALLTMGVSVVSGAITTMLSGFMLVFPSYVFFYKMGWIIVTTVLLALMWAMIFFSSIVALWGPEGNTGDINKYLVFCPCQQCKKEEESGLATLAGPTTSGKAEPAEEGGVELQTQA